MMPNGVSRVVVYEAEERVREEGRSLMLGSASGMCFPDRLNAEGVGRLDATHPHGVVWTMGGFFAIR